MHRIFKKGYKLQSQQLLSEEIHSMGKCVSKPSSKTIGNFGSTAYIAISERSYELSINEGQSESKKNAKKERGTVETKGTAMSFGFKKKNSNSTAAATLANKKNGNFNNKQKEKEKEKEKGKFDNNGKYNTSATVITNPGILNADNSGGDKNGNTGSTDSLDDEHLTGRSTPRLLAPRKEISETNYRSNRFGFRQTNIVRPASTGLTPKVADFDNITNNNNIDKRRSKSASGPGSSSRSATPIVQQQQVVHQQNHQYPKINTTVSSNQQKQDKQKNATEMQSSAMNSYQNKTTGTTTTTTMTGNQYTVIETGMHTNEIVRPIPQTASVAASVSKFTLHTSSLPRPQYPVPISLTPRYVMDTKGAKQAANNSRRGFQGMRDISSDSGVTSYDSTDRVESGSPRKMRLRQRNLELVMSGRHTFQVRDLEDSLSDDAIIPLALPKLPSAFNSSHQPAPLSGLIRTEQQSQPRNNWDIHDDILMMGKSMSSDIDSLEEEKLFRDKSTTEKGLKNVTGKDYSPCSKTSSPGSSRASWCNAGESMANKDCSSLSLSSSDESKDHRAIHDLELPQEEDISSITLTTGHQSLLSSVTIPSLPTSGTMDLIKAPNNNNENLLALEDTKFAEMAAAVSDILLDDETSPTDSLVSSCTDTDELMKKNKKKLNDSIKEKDIDEISPELDLNITSPMSPGTPTHASNSLSLSDGGRDFLIDDEIADQPALVFDDKNETTSVIHQLSATDTPTLIDTFSAKSLNVAKPNQMKPIIAVSPLNSQSSAVAHPPPPMKPRRLPRSESLDTLSPCESIASDDLMMDFESQSSLDSIDKIPKSIGSGSGSALHSMDETQLWSELEAQGGELLREWSTLLRGTSKIYSRDSITSQLPARATRLLNRSRIQSTLSSNAGSDSPRSLDGIPRRASSVTKTSPHLYRDNASSPDEMQYLDKSLRNSMIQDIIYFKKQLIRLRKLLQEDEESLKRTDTLNPFEIINGPFFSSCGGGGSGSGPVESIKQEQHLNDGNLGSLTSLQSNESLTPSLTDDPKQELADLRRQVVYLQGQMDDKDRTIRIQKNLIAKYEAEKQQIVTTTATQPETINTATQTDRIRPLSTIGQEGLARSESSNERSSTPSIPTSSSSASASSSLISSPTPPSPPASVVKPVRATKIGNIFRHHQSVNERPSVASMSNVCDTDTTNITNINIIANGESEFVSKSVTSPNPSNTINGRKIPIFAKSQFLRCPARIPRSASSSRSSSVTSSSSSLIDHSAVNRNSEEINNKNNGKFTNGLSPSLVHDPNRKKTNSIKIVIGKIEPTLITCGNAENGKILNVNKKLSLSKDRNEWC